MYQEDFLVEQNMDLVQQIARKRFAGRMPDDDLIQQGNIGLWEAARKWNGTGSFRAFACICIYHNMIDHVRRPSKPTGELSAAGEDKEAYLYCDDLEEMELGDEIRRAWPEGTTERRVLTLLASGMDKHAVAAQMGTGVRQIKRVAKRAWRGVERIRAEKTAGE